jgi:ADP-ribose pyrophosphatase YjhB (NUDIX family)
MPHYPSTGGPIVRKVPEGDDRPRLVCDTCGFIRYDNPKVVVGSVATWDGRILLCRRAIEPQAGFWTLPAGFLELKEEPEEGARREAEEEACAEIEIDALLGVYTIPRISLVQLIYRAKLAKAEIAPGIESLEVALFEWDAIPWDDLAFPSVTWALRHYAEAGDRAAFPPFTNPEGDVGSYEPGVAARR